jgi:hypothetical protein
MSDDFIQFNTGPLDIDMREYDPLREKKQQVKIAGPEAKKPTPPPDAICHHWRPGSAEMQDYCQAHHDNAACEQHEASGGYCVWVFSGKCERCGG